MVASAQRPISFPALVLETNGSTVIPGSAGLMHWRIADHGFSMGLSPQVPQTVAQALRPWLDDWLGGWDLTPASISSWAMHPGGPRILSACGEVLELSPEQLQTSRAVLHDHRVGRGSNDGLAVLGEDELGRGLVDISSLRVPDQHLHSLLACSISPELTACACSCAYQCACSC